MSTDVPHLDHPPIVEVVCGYYFDALALTPLESGIYWHQRRSDFPGRELRPALQSGTGFRIGGAPELRAWLISEAGDYLLQLQHDRFYMNWRRQDGAYPRFGGRAGDKGLGERAHEEFDAFCRFCEVHLEASPRPVRLELAKIDVLRRGDHYESLEDLGTLLKVARVFEDVQAGGTSNLHLRLVEQTDADEVQVSIRVLDEAVHMETRTLFAPGDAPDDAFARANARMNRVFFGLLNEEELGRFSQP